MKGIAFAMMLVVGLFASVARAGDLKPPTRDPVPTTEAHAPILKEGIALHDEGKFAEAAAKYQAVLAENPDDVLALYELAFTLQSAGESRKALEIAMRGATYKSVHLSKFYTVIGNSHDVLGSPEKAIEAYEAGVRVSPDDAVLRFNLGVTYAGLKKFDKARTEFKAAADAEPDYPSAHFGLAQLYFNDGYRVPALLAASRFCVLEPVSKRSEAARRIIATVLQGGVKPGTKPNEISITLDVNSKKDEGDFGIVETMIGIARAAGYTEKAAGKSDLEKLVEQWESVLSVLAEADTAKDRKLFVGRHYVPYFTALHAKGFDEPFVYITLAGSDTPGVTEWIRTNKERATEFVAWSKAYPWPSKKN